MCERDGGGGGIYCVRETKVVGGERLVVRETKVGGGVVVRKIAQEGGGKVRRAFLEKWFTKKLDVNHFSNFNKGFFGLQKLFSV